MGPLPPARLKSLVGGVFRGCRGCVVQELGWKEVMTEVGDDGGGDGGGGDGGGGDGGGGWIGALSVDAAGRVAPADTVMTP
jgi:hypothetical protein